MVPLLIFAAIMMVLLEKQERASVERGLRDTARALSVAVDNQLIASVSTLQALAAFDHPDAMDLERFHVQARRVLATQPGWRNIALHDRAGRQLISAAHPFGAPLPPAGNVEMVSQALDTGVVVISNLFVSPVLNVPVVGVSVPLVRHGIVRYVLGARLDVAALGRVLSEGKLPEEWIGTIIDREGTIVARTRGIEEFLGHPAAPEVVAQSRLSEEGSLGAMSLDGIATQTVFSRSRLSGWSVTLAIPDALVEASGRRSLWAMIGGGLRIPVDRRCLGHDGRPAHRPRDRVTLRLRAGARGGEDACGGRRIRHHGGGRRRARNDRICAWAGRRRGRTAE